ncbi:MAG: hypothetical protein K6T81_04300 [Alicyclobacillus macrosporangiidus]|uniref:phage tail assembly chaperone n=1 Tax=Alicyclobacillus macrosporangiidus TaxID=392015 RepID=UPI0026EC05DE|nr:hypothetical protein [Alicyclobacillus macrosporangiidus]MCL6597940.1 hypothetical protein [Alicyclobacillus macrosporangiidus]
MSDLNKEDVLAFEGDLLQGLLQAGEDAQSETVSITIQRKGKTYFAFRIRPLTEQEYNEAAEKATTYERNRQLGVRIPQSRDDALFRSLLIYKATVDEDRQKLWNNKAAWQHFNVLSGPDLIDRVLLPGEKLAVVGKIDELSGYGTDLEETAKNSSRPEDGQPSSTTSSSESA